MALIEADLIAATVGRDTGARRVKVIRPVSFSVRDLWAGLIGLADYRDLLIALSAHRLKVRYKQSVLGIAWAIIQPVALMLIYTLVFSIVTKVKSTGVPYAVFAYAALLPWSFFSTALTNATNGLVSHAQLVTKVYFPREILPISYVVAALVDLLVASIIMMVLMLWYHVALTPSLLWVVPITFVMTAFVSGCSLIFSAMQVRVRDIGMAMPLLLQLWMFASPVVYPLHQVPARYRDWYVLNPMVGVIENFRAALLGTALEDDRVVINSLTFRAPDGTRPAVFHSGDPLVAQIEFDAHEPVDDAVFEVFVRTGDLTEMCQLTTETSGAPIDLPRGPGTLRFECRELALQPGMYHANVCVKERVASEAINWQYHAATIRVDPGKVTRGQFYQANSWCLTAPGAAAVAGPTSSAASQDTPHRPSLASSS